MKRVLKNLPDFAIVRELKEKEIYEDERDIKTDGIPFGCARD